MFSRRCESGSRFKNLWRQDFFNVFGERGVLKRVKFGSLNSLRLSRVLKQKNWKSVFTYFFAS